MYLICDLFTFIPPTTLRLVILNWGATASLGVVRPPSVVL